MQRNAAGGNRRAVAEWWDVASIRDSAIEVGWDIVDSPQPPRIHVNRIGGVSAFATRIRATPMTARWAHPRQGGEPRWRAILMVEGEAEFCFGGRHRLVREGELMIDDLDALEFRSARPTTMLSASGPWHERIGAGFGPAASPARVLRPSAVSASLFTSVLNQGIAARLSSADSAFAAYWRTVEHAVAYLAQSGGSWIPDGLSPANAELYRRALTFLEQNYHRADLSMAQISDGAFSSASSLFRAFRAAGTTPRAELRRLRAAAARERMELGGPDVDIVAVARTSGFPSTAAMQAALTGRSRGSAQPTPAGGV
ncbi:hypothetical protein [Microbacterium panaciterrae]|uniref:HTH araC/xylS-type domain-containing protein n=1 Tax=Microbacterium panaciterrae TaxID=985759 RepID=A0ABP8PEA1_9MICO